MVVIVHGPAGCGKTRNEDALAAKYGCSQVADLWDVEQQKMRIDDGAKLLVLTTDEDAALRRFPGATSVPFAVAKMGLI